MSSCNAKVIFVMGATGTGKSRLSIDLATRFNGEIINSDKMQVYKGLDIVTNKVTELEMQGVKHYLLDEIEPESDFSANDFCFRAISAVESIVKSGKLPIIVGGSNSYIEALVEDPSFEFKSKYSCCFLWLDVSLPISFSFVSKRVDQMVEAGLVNEVREMFVPGADYTRGIRRSIGVPEMDEYLKNEEKLKKMNKEMLLKTSIEEIKVNTFKLVCRQLDKIKRLRNELKWPIHRIDATLVFEKRGKEITGHAWDELVVQSLKVNEFLQEEEKIALAKIQNNVISFQEKMQVKVDAAIHDVGSICVNTQ